MIDGEPRPKVIDRADPEVADRMRAYLGRAMLSSGLNYPTSPPTNLTPVETQRLDGILRGNVPVLPFEDDTVLGE